MMTITCEKLNDMFELGLDIIKEYVLKNVFYQLINTERNKEYLKKVVSTPIEDLSIRYCVKMDEKLAFVVTKEISEYLNVCEDELNRAALWNSPKIEPVKIFGTSEILSGIPKGNPYKDELVCVTNISGTFGAASILYPDVVEEIMRYGDFYLIPSSVHEFLLQRKGEKKPQEIRDIIMEENSNENVVLRSEILSNNLYEFDRNGRLRIVEY